MARKPFDQVSRRTCLAGTAAMLSTPAIAQTTDDPTFDPLRPPPEPEPAVRRNISSFRALDWQPYFSNTKKGAVLVDTQSYQQSILSSV